MGEEQLELASRLPGLVERKLIATFGHLVRSRSGLERLFRSLSADDLAAGYSIGVQSFWGKSDGHSSIPKGV